MHARSINQHDLCAALALNLGQVHDALDPVACGLRLGRDDGQLLAHERIEQGGLASVRTTEDADKTGAERHRG